MKPREKVVELGCEGGSITVYRVSAQEQSYFESDVHDWTPTLLDEEPIHSTITAGSWDEMVGLLNEHRWHTLAPIFIHCDFRRLVWTAIQSRLDGERAVERWREACGG